MLFTVTSTLDAVFLSYTCMCLNTKKCIIYYEMEGEIDRESLFNPLLSYVSMNTSLFSFSNSFLACAYCI